MPNYIVNKNAQSGSNDHEVHRLDTQYNCLPLSQNRVDLGWHAGCASAVRQAKQYHYSDSNGCSYCSPERHTT